MKKLLLLLFMFLSYNLQAQITFEHSYPNGSFGAGGALRLVKLNSSGYKYMTTDSLKLRLYNLDHSLFRSIDIPQHDSSYNGLCFFVSDDLFDTDPNTIEYLYQYSNSITYVYKIRVYNEFGDSLFVRDSSSIHDGQYNDMSGGTIRYTTDGVKMFLESGVNRSDVYVYSLPGVLPCSECNNGIVSGIGVATDNSPSGRMMNYPNPSSDQTTIKYSLPNGIYQADLVFYDTFGKEVKRFSVTNAFQDIIVSTSDLVAGTYFYQLQSNGNTMNAKKMVVIK